MNKKEVNYIIRNVAIFLITTLSIVFFLPREKSFHYEYELGKPWKYEQLIASFDFSVEKTEKELASEQAKLLKGIQPYYSRNTQSEAEMLLKMQNEFNGLLPHTSFIKLQKALTKAYESGIVSSDKLQSLIKDSVLFIKVYEGSTVQKYPVSQLLTVQDVYQSIMADTLLKHDYNLNAFIAPNFVYDKTKTETAQEEALKTIIPRGELVVAGQKVIGSGDIITERSFQVLNSYKKEALKRISLTGKKFTLSGQILLTSLLIAIFAFYLQIYRKDYLKEMHKLLFLMSQIIIFPIIASFFTQKGYSIMAIPFIIVPIMVRVFMDSRTAFMGHLVITLTCSIFAPAPYIFILLQLTAGLIAIYTLTELSERSQLFQVTVAVLLTYSLVYFSYDLINENSFKDFDKGSYIAFTTNAILLLFTYPLMFLYEKLFGFTSNVTLVELSNINGKLLRLLSETAPGTFQHSMQVANLAAAAANKVGAKSQLVRTGALYHDIGKLENPVFFTENQGSINPHSCLSYEQSAEIVINHVQNGLKLADKYHLPEAIKQFIRTHHGTSKAKYFYICYKNEHPGETIDEGMFTYPGPNPSTMETAILMMADSVEAASRSLPEYTEESINNLVDRIIDTQVQEGYFKECPLTFKDIMNIKTVFKEKLTTIYHTRVSYPELKKS